jgi:hypothetical protein
MHLSGSVSGGEYSISDTPRRRNKFLFEAR